MECVDSSISSVQREKVINEASVHVMQGDQIMSLRLKMLRCGINADVVAVEACSESYIEISAHFYSTRHMPVRCIIHLSAWEGH